MPLFNATHPRPAPHFVSQRVVDAPAAVRPQPNPSRPRVRTDFGQMMAAPATVASAPKAASSYPVSGYFSTIRAALVANSLQLGAWNPSGFPRYLAAQLPTAGDPSPSAADNATDYANHLTMSYLPAQTEVTAQTFASLNDPTKRPSAMSSLTTNINGGTADSQPQTLDNVQPSNVPLIPYAPSVPPWGNLLCNQSYFGVQIRTAGVALNPGNTIAVLQPSNVPGFVSQ